MKLDANPASCDDGNILSHDGWSSSWVIEAGYSWSLDPSSSPMSIWVFNCGNGIYNPLSNEQWDDGNVISGDGWSNICRIESGFSWVINKDIQGVWSFMWGNGITESLNLEQWDDGNNISGDGCDSSCNIEDKYIWKIFNNMHYQSICFNTCGNGLVDPLEMCDDGNNILGDGWDVNWNKEEGYDWSNVSGKSSFWFPLWGNGIRDSVSIAEEWDDGNDISFDGWSKSCKIEKNYICIQSTAGPDQWSTKYPSPIIKNSTFDATNLLITIEFDQLMQKQNITIIDMSLEITGPNSPYISKWNAEFEK